MDNLKVNDKVVTPNGVGILQGRMYENGWQYLIVRHNLNEMTDKPERRCLTLKSITTDKFKTGVWYYDPNEVSHA